MYDGGLGLEPTMREREREKPLLSSYPMREAATQLSLYVSIYIFNQHDVLDYLYAFPFPLIPFFLLLFFSGFACLLSFLRADRIWLSGKDTDGP